MKEVLLSWHKILSGRLPFLSIEVTRECPLSCPGCYAYGAEHLGSTVTLREVSDLKGPALVEGVVSLVDRYRPIHVSLVGGEPLVRYRELSSLLPLLANRGIRTQVVTSAVRQIPADWKAIPNLNVSVSIDGLQPEHDARRKPATYDRILENIAGHSVTVHCTVTRQQIEREGYLDEFARFWSAHPGVKRIWFSLYTPQIGEESSELLKPKDRLRAIQKIMHLRTIYPKIEMPKGLLAAYAKPPESPRDCIFARLTHCVSADLKTRITPCQFGGKPDCKNCGCMASAGMTAIGRHRLAGVLPLQTIMSASIGVGNIVRAFRPDVS